jgi:glutamate racemase
LEVLKEVYSQRTLNTRPRKTQCPKKGEVGLPTSIMNKNSPIGIFDSGLGGLTALKELCTLLPFEDIIYFGDTGRVPYGTKSKETIIKYAKQDISFLESLNVKIIIAACGTVSSIADSLEGFATTPFINVITPTSVAAINQTKTQKIGILGTSATINSHSYAKKLLFFNKNLKIFEKACPLFVPLVENGIISKDDPVLLDIANRYLCEFENKCIDTLILGCTHYPIITEAISFVVGKNIKIVNSGKETAVYAAEYLKTNNMLKTGKTKGVLSFYVSDSIQNFKKESQRFLNLNDDYEIKKVDMDCL